MTRDELKEECARIRLSPDDIKYIMALGNHEYRLEQAAATIVKKLYEQLLPLIDTDDGKPALFVERERDTGKWMRQTFLSREEHQAFAKTADHNFANYQLVGLHLRPARLRQK